MATNKRRKILKIAGITFVILLALLIAIPFFLEGKIAEILKNKVNQNVNATLEFENADLSLLRSFPQAYVNLSNVSLVNKAAFEGDTLFAAHDISLEMSIKELFKSADEPIAIKSLTVEGSKMHIKIDEADNANYDIAKEEIEPAGPTANETNNFTFDLQSYSISDSEVIYDDFSSGIHLVVSEINHSGTGDLSLAESELQTQTEALVSFEMDSINYLNKNRVALDALIGIDLEESKYSFLKNEALVNQLPLVFDGFVKVNEDNQEVAISFKTPSSDFKNFLAVIPEEYSKNIENVQTTGNFLVEGEIMGIVDEEHIPKFNIKINSENASFKYPDLPKTVRNVFIDTEVVNSTGISEDTYVNIKKLSFQIDEDRFNVVSNITELLGNTKVAADLDGTINLSNVSKAYPVPADYDLAGILNADVSTKFDMASVEQKRYQNTQTTGTMSVKNFEYNSPELKNPVAITTAAVTFNPNTVSLNSFTGKTGQTDFNATGNITNLLGYLFNKENIEGKFKLNSNTFAVNDFMVAEAENDFNEDSGTTENSSATSEERVKIPSFLDCTIDATADKVLYDNLNLTNVSGRLVVKDETVTLQNLVSSLFGGNLSLNGKVSTKTEVSVFEIDLGVKDFQISESFASVEMLRTLAPIAKVLEGKMNSSIKLSGSLKDDMTPSLTSLTGNLLAELLSTKVSAERTPLLSALDGKLNFLNLDELDLNGLKTALNFENGVVSVKPFKVQYKDIAINVTGGHTFDSQLQYAATLAVPAKYLGKQVNDLLAKIDDSSLENLTLPVTANIGGNYTSPNVTTDLTSGITKLTNQLVEIQKQKLVGQGKDKAKDLIGGLFKKDSTATDTTATKKPSVKGVLGGLLGGAKKDTTVVKKDSTAVKRDSVTPESAAKNAAKNVLGNLLGKKKKDTVN